MRQEEEETGSGRPPVDGGPFAEPWLLASCLCLLAAAVCLWLALFDAAFVAAALGAVAWFLNVRSRLPRRDPEPEAEEDEE